MDLYVGKIRLLIKYKEITRALTQRSNSVLLYFLSKYLENFHQPQPRSELNQSMVNYCHFGILELIDCLLDAHKILQY